MRQAVFIALGLALGVGLVVTVAAASAGVKKAQSGVLSALYGVGTDVTVTGAVPGPPAPGAPRPVKPLRLGPNGMEICTASGTCTSAAGKTVDNVVSQYSGISESEVAEVARLHGVASAAGGITLSESAVTFGSSASAPLDSSSLTLDGVDTRHPSLGPLSTASLTSGHSFAAAEADSDVAVVDSGYARSNRLSVGSVLTIDQVKFTVTGIVRQAQASSPPDVYVPLQRAQAMSVFPYSLANGVNTIYVAAASAATLANDLGKWLAVLVLIAAFAVASLLTMAAVARRVTEFGTLKAIGWRTRRIVAQVLGESVAMGIVGAAAGVGLGFAGAAIITRVAPKLSGGVSANTGLQASGPGVVPGGLIGGSSPHPVSVPLHPSVTASVIVLAVVLAILGGLLAGSFGSWRIARLRPADALARVA
jgi:putative ABC transport system permease protein